MQLEPITSCSLADLGEHRQPLMAVDAGVSTRISQHRDVDISVSRNPGMHGTSSVRCSPQTEHSSDLALPANDSFVDKTDSAAPKPPEDLEKMARRRYQNPKPFKEGAFWWLLCWQDDFVNGVRTRKRKRIKLAPATMAAREARKVASEYISPLNHGLVSLGSATNFTEYVNSHI
jgi:hypothetical protein